MITCHPNCPVMQAHFRRRVVRHGGVHVMDPSKSLYHIWEPNKFTHRCKLRPFCAEFLTAAMRDFEVHFNTAATRLYGIKIIQVLKEELLKKSNGNDEAWRMQIELTFNESRLITREDKQKYQASGSRGVDPELYRKAENILRSQQLPITQQYINREVDRLNFTKKSLDALAGGDDTFFVILDDRNDVWPTEVKLFDCRQPQTLPSENLLQIPPYFYFDD